MFRTRDFMLLFVTVVFLLVAIGATVFSKWGSSQSGVDLQLASGAGGEGGAEVVLPETLSREERLAAMRQKIAASAELSLTEPADIVPATTLEEATPAATTSPPVAAGGEPLLCPRYSAYTTPWPLGGVQLEVAEGARIVYTEIEVSSQPPPNATSTPPFASVTQRNILLQLPIRQHSSGATKCLTTDVVGVAQDGSLIRNTEAGLYGVFGADTLIGYALDGFPIYGVSPTPTDTCGGTTVVGTYRYHLSSERETVLNCFSATPASL